jgi:5-methyltetrahydropteroyltriglutamate--homocysteine methyltransferase
MEYRAEQVGSLLRPPELLRARQDFAARKITLEELGLVEDVGILDALEMQREVGIDVFTDGELRRGGWLTDLAEAVEGFVPERMPLTWHRGGREETELSIGNVVGGPLRPTRRITAHETSFLREHAPGPFKMTMPSPSVFMHIGYKPGLTDRFYPTRDDLLDALVDIIRGEIVALIDEGVPYIQLDNPQYAPYMDPQLREEMRGRGIDPDAAAREAVAADTRCLEGLAREGVTLALHVCRGNSKSRWLAEGGYDPIAEELFQKLPVNRFLLEYDSDRAGSFEPLRFVPPDKTVVLGLVTTKEPDLESQDDLQRRIDEAARYVPLERLALSPQCGFASVAAGNAISQDDERRKLELVVDTARKVWGGG